MDKNTDQGYRIKQQNARRDQCNNKTIRIRNYSVLAVIYTIHFKSCFSLQFCEIVWKCKWMPRSSYSDDIVLQHKVKYEINWVKPVREIQKSSILLIVLGLIGGGATPGPRPVYITIAFKSNRQFVDSCACRTEYIAGASRVVSNFEKKIQRISNKGT